MISPVEWQSRMNNLIRDYTAFRNWESLEELVTETKDVGSWRDFQGTGQPRLQGKWCFRGQGDQSWILMSSLDRDVRGGPERTPLAA